MADATLSTEFSRRAMLAGASVAALGVGPGFAVSRGVSSSPEPPSASRSAPSRSFGAAPSPIPPPRAGEGLYAAGAPPTLLMPPPPAALVNPGDALIALLAGEYRRVQAAITDCIDAAEACGGMFAYTDQPWKARIEALAAREDALVEQLGRTRPDSILGLAIKLRAAVFPGEDGFPAPSRGERLLRSAMEDLDRMAEAALLG